MYRIRAFLDTFGKLVAVEAGTSVTLGGVLADRQDVVRTTDAGASEGETVGEGRAVMSGLLRLPTVQPS